MKQVILRRFRIATVVMRLIALRPADFISAHGCTEGLDAKSQLRELGNMADRATLFVFIKPCSVFFPRFRPVL